MGSNFLLRDKRGSGPKAAWDFDRVRITILDRIFDRDDMLVMLTPDPINERG